MTVAEGSLDWMTASFLAAVDPTETPPPLFPELFEGELVRTPLLTSIPTTTMMVEKLELRKNKNNGSFHPTVPAPPWR